MNSPPTLRSASFFVGQCDLCSRGSHHRRTPLLSIAEIANWLPEVSISTYSLAVCFEYLAIRSDLTINKLVSDYSDKLPSSVRDEPVPDHVQYQHRSFDKVSFIIDRGAYR